MRWKTNVGRISLLLNGKGKLWNRRILRKILALLFLFLIFLLFIWSLKEDYRLKDVGQMFRFLHQTGMIHYTIQLKSFNPENQTVNGTLSAEQGMLPPEMYSDPGKILYGPLLCNDLTFPYAIGFFFLPNYEKLLPQKSFQKINPQPIEISIKALGNPEIYPFDKYFIMCAVKCPAYFIEGKTKKYLENQEHGESLSIINSINGLFVRTPRKKELNQIKASFQRMNRSFRPVDDKDLKEINNFKDIFALIIERPYYLRFMTVALGAIVFAYACYIGFALPLTNVPVSILGFVAALWGIRSILLSDTKIFLSYFDYIGLFMYLLLFGGIAFRAIWKGRVVH